MKIVITSGEPSSIGPDICLELLQNINHHKEFANIQIDILGNNNLFANRAQLLKMNFAALLAQSKNINFINLDIPELVEVGKPNPANAKYILTMLDMAIAGCQNKTYSAMVTAPIQKSSIISAGFINFKGHTEYLAEVTKTDFPVMLLASDEIKVVPLTTHIPIAKVPQNISQNLLINTLDVIAQEFVNKYKIKRPTIAVLGLNPHNGEDGKIGNEEINIINPAIEKFKKNNNEVNLIRALSADTAFLAPMRDKVDVYVGMYHDQVLPIFKTLSFGEGVNITLGLPIIRTSVDHGTALNLAGSGKASYQGLISAVNHAINLIKTND